jgi:hypothetical protein
MSELKDLYKPGRKMSEYIDKDGKLIIYCTTCIHRLPSIEFGWGYWL